MILFENLQKFQNSSLSTHISIDIGLFFQDLRDEKIQQLAQPLSNCINLQTLKLFL
ncbi:hypothetical protein ABPG72_022044, partial [Tetrahymena utriculariae]